MVDDDLRSLSMGGTANVEEENRDLAKVVHKLACMGVRLKDEGAPPASWLVLIRPSRGISSPKN